MTIANTVLVFAALTTALMAGLFYAWSVSVMPGFARLSNKEFIAAMRATNQAIQNTVFFIAFFGAPLFLIIATAFHHNQSNRLWLLLAATVIYLTGTFGVTIFGNVPLNNALERFRLEGATDEEILRQRKSFERRWNDLNHVRSISVTVAVILVVIACLN